MTTKELAEFIGRDVKLKIGVGTASWKIPARVLDVRLRYGIRDYQVEFDKQITWISESNVIFPERS